MSRYSDNTETYSLFTMIAVFVLVLLEVFNTVRNEKLRLKAESEAARAKKAIEEQVKALKRLHHFQAAP